MLKFPDTDIEFEWVGYSSVFTDHYYQPVFTRRCSPQIYFNITKTELRQVPSLTVLRSDLMLRVKRELERRGYTVKITAKALTE
mgnify:CR=1 FL=1